MVILQHAKHRLHALARKVAKFCRTAALLPPRSSHLKMACWAKQAGVSMSSAQSKSTRRWAIEEPTEEPSWVTEDSSVPPANNGVLRWGG